jgi:2-phospho-L-lactate/phosphoenolpyruvate guanylyltransferase
MTPSPSTAPLALVPLRSGGKTRLGSRLDAGLRSTLATAMLEDVCTTLADAGIDRIVVAARGAAATEAARALDVEVLPDEPGDGDLDTAVAHATRALHAPAGMLVVAADLPCLRVQDVHAVLAPAADVVVAPTADGGTGGLLRRRAAAVGTAYGPGSAARHAALAAAAGLSCATVETVGFHRDVDTVEDLAALRLGQVGRSTGRALPRTIPGHARA